MSVLDRALQDPVVRAALEESGWSPGYRYDTTAWVESLREQGFHVHARGEEVLAALGGLVIDPPTSVRATFGTGRVVVDPLWAATDEAERVRERERQLGVELCPVAEWLGEYVVLVAPDGRTFAETTFQVLELGQDPSEALVRLVTADSPPVELAV